MESAHTQLMVTDILTPVQYYDGVHRENPETQAIKQLMVAVLANRALLPNLRQRPEPRRAPDVRRCRMVAFGPQQ